MHGNVIGMVVATVWIERDDHVRRDVENDLSDRRFDSEHVRVHQGARVIAPQPLVASRVVETEHHRGLDAEPRARDAQLFSAERAEIRDAAD